MQLADLGWDQSWREALLARPDGTLRRLGREQAAGRIVRVDKGLCSVLTETGPVRASLGGDVLDAIAREASAAPCTGDWALLRHWPDGPTTVEALAPRRTSLVRADASKSSHGQALAANVDIVAAVVGLHPEPNLGRIERLLTVAWESGAEPVVILTKADLVVDAEAIAEDVRAVAPGVRVISCSPTTGQGLDDVRDLLAEGRTIVLIGASGHGKSTLTNALIGADVLPTRAIREDGKGRHTSVARELMMVPGGGAIIDTPGLRGVGLQRDGGSLEAAFPDVDRLAQDCKFRDCRHEAEPGCAVQAAVASGELTVRRLESWQKLRRELVWIETRTDARLRSEQQKKWRDLTKQSRANRRDRPS